MRSRYANSGMLLAAALVFGCEADPVVKPIEPPPSPTNPTEFIEELENAYGRMDLDLYQSLFPEDAEAPFLFIVNEPDWGEPTNWDLDEELRIHRRMFEPENAVAGEDPVPSDLHLKAIIITLTPVGDWTERFDLYASPIDPAGLDAARWRATEALYQARVLWDTESNNDYLIDALQNFIVIEDLARPAGEARKFLLYRWEDYGYGPQLSATQMATWSQLKALYR